jgi:hypothetical protein
MGLILVPVTSEASPPSSRPRDLEVVMPRLVVATVRGGDFLLANDTVSWLHRGKYRKH